MPFLHNSYDYNACSSLNCFLKINGQKSIINYDQACNHIRQSYHSENAISNCMMVFSNTCALYKNYVPFDQEFFSSNYHDDWIQFNP